MALSLCIQEVLWTRAMLTDMGMIQNNATQIWEDNQGAIALAQNAGYHARTKHVDIRHHFSREKVEDKTVVITYVDTLKSVGRHNDQGARIQDVQVPAQCERNPVQRHQAVAVSGSVE